MKVDRDETVGSQPILRVRNFLRKMGSKEFTNGYAVEFFHLSEPKSDEMLNALIERGFIDRTRLDHGYTWYRITSEGRRLASSNFARRISRSKAEALLEAFLERVRNVNARDELGYIVNEVRVFGSYLNGAADLGDIDLVVDLRWRDPERDIIKYSCLRAAQSGRQIRTYPELIGYSEIEVRRILKHRSPYISLHGQGELDSIGGTSPGAAGAERLYAGSATCD